MAELKAHFFICTNTRASGKSCGNSGGVALRDSVKQRCKEVLGTDASLVRINSSGCLGHCEKGIAGVCYPQGQWFFELQSDSKTVETLVDFVRERVREKK